jgi:hypothetical protein
VLKREHSSAGICFTIPSVRLIVPTESVRGLASISKTLTTTREMAMKLTSPAFANGAVIPKEYTADGRDISPPLSWSEVPAGTKSFALVCEDPDCSTWFVGALGYFQHTGQHAVATSRCPTARYFAGRFTAGPQRFWADWLWGAFTAAWQTAPVFFPAVRSGYGCRLATRCHPRYAVESHARTHP